MKKIIFLLLCLTSSMLASSQIEDIPIRLRLQLEKRYTKTFSKNEYWAKQTIQRQDLNVNTDSIIQHHYDLIIEVENTSEKEIYIWLMTCSWLDNFEINNNYMYFEITGCDSNYPVLEAIKPKSKLTLKTTIRKNIKFDYPNKNSVYGPQVELTKLGLIIVDDIYNPDKDFFNYWLNMEDKSKHRIIWSNGLNLWGEQPNPKPWIRK